MRTSTNHQSYKFGNERIFISTQILCTVHLTHFLKVILFGADNNLSKGYECVHRTQKQAVVHIASYERMQSIFTKNGLNAACHFLNEDEYEMVWGAAGKVWLRKGKEGCECVGYVISESDDDIEVLLEGDRQNTRVTLSRPRYDARNGRYILNTDDSQTSTTTVTHDHYEIIQYWPVVMKINTSGKLHIILNRMQMAYDSSCIVNLHNSAIVIESKHITHVHSPLDVI